MKRKPVWMVQSKVGHMYGPFRNAHLAGKWAVKYISNNQFVLLRVTPP